MLPKTKTEGDPLAHFDINGEIDTDGSPLRSRSNQVPLVEGLLGVAGRLTINPTDGGTTQHPYDEMYASSVGAKDAAALNEMLKVDNFLQATPGPSAEPDKLSAMRLNSVGESSHRDSIMESPDRQINDPAKFA